MIVKAIGLALSCIVATAIVGWMLHVHHHRRRGRQLWDEAYRRGVREGIRREQRKGRQR